MDSGQESLCTPRRAQKCLFAPSNSANKKTISHDANYNNKVIETSSEEDSDLGPMLPLALADQSPSCDSSSGREYISPLTTPEKSPNLHTSQMSWDRLKSRCNRENHISPFRSLKKVTRAARYSPRCKLFNTFPKSLPSSPGKQAALLSPQHPKTTEGMMDEVVPETPQTRSFATEIQNQDITETPRKSSSHLHKELTPFRFISKTAPLPKLHRRKSLSSLETSELRDFSPRQKENVLKRRAQDQLATTSAKLLKADDASSCVPRARAALFQDRRTECGSLKDFSLSTGKFYSSNARTERPFAFNIKNSDVKKRRSLPVQSSHKRLLKRQKFGINAGVFHGIRKPRPKAHSEVSKNEKEHSTQNSPVQSASKSSPPAEETQQASASAERAPSPQVDESKRFFKTNKTIRHNAATVTVSNKIKLKVADGKIMLNTNRVPSASAPRKQQEQTSKDVLLDATDLTVDEPEVQATLEQDKVADLLRILEDDWADDDYDQMAPCGSSSSSSSLMTNTVSPLKPVMMVPTDSIMSPASELINLTSTMNITDMDSQAQDPSEDPSLDSVNNNDTEKTNEKESGDKYFPIFNKDYFASGNIFEDASNAKPSKTPRRSTQWQLSARGGGAEDQYQLDVGQKRFGATQCPECNIVYQLGDPEDENAHLNYHNSVHILKFQGWKNERVIMEDSFTSSRIILVEPHESKQYWKKISDILTVVDRDLGLSEMNISEYQNKKIYLYIREKTILGVLVAEPITRAHRMIPDLVELDCCTAESTPTKCGVNVVWTAMSHRKQGIATKLVDTLRATYFYGYMMTLDDIAFSIPTPSGKIFAEKYTKTRNFKVYN